MSDDGRYIVFSSSAALAPGAVADLGEAYVRDRVAGTTTLLSANITGGSTATFPNSLGAVTSAMSREGGVALFESHRTLHTALPDNNEQADLFAFAVTPGTPGGGTAVLSLTASDQGAKAMPGAEIYYRLDYRNTGTAAAPTPVISLRVPDATRWMPNASTPGWQCTPDGEAGGACTLALPPLAAGATGSAQFVVEIDEDARPGGALAGALRSDGVRVMDADSPISIFLAGIFGSSFLEETVWGTCAEADTTMGYWTSCCIVPFLLDLPFSEAVVAANGRASAAATPADMTTLYDIRDQVLRPTPNGQHYADLYYTHMASVRDTIIGNAGLLARAKAMLDDWMPGLTALAGGQGDTVVITSQRMTTLVTFLQDVSAAAPEPLKSVILDELTRFPASELAGMTMAQAARRLGVHDGGPYKRYFAEGATGGFFKTVLALSNTAATAVDATVRFLTTAGQTIQHLVTVPAHGSTTLDVGTVTGMAAAEFSTVVESATPIVVDRTLTWDVSRYGSHSETSLAAPSLTWYLAEGATHSGFDLFYLLQNPDPQQAASVTVRFLRPSGAPLTKTYTVAPSSRANIWVNQEEFDVQGVATRLLSSTDVSATFEVTNGVPIIVERALYRSTPSLTFGAGHESAGVTAPATQWFLAEGATGDYFDLFVLIANPTDQPAQVRARYLLPSGQVLTKDHTVTANSRFNIWVDQEELPAGSGQFPLADTAVSTTIESLNGVRVIVERAMWWPGTAATWYEAHNSPGSTTSGYVWTVADGEVGGAASLETYVLIANVSATAGQAKVTLLFDDGTTAVKYVALPANSRNNVSVKDEFATAAGRRFGVLVESIGAPRAQIVVERAVYGNANGEIWTAGSNALATRVR
ncbi:MAG: hypothetical protein JNM38_17710 [Acidobacteria bacterium]|nr:hypothetical protein [Acidobacteriota bacterium]